MTEAGHIEEAEAGAAETGRRPRRAFVLPRRPAFVVRPRKAKVKGLAASASHALEQRQLFVLLPFAIIAGLVASLVAAEPPEPLALAAVAVLIVAALWLARRSLVALRLLTLTAAFWVGFSLLAIHGALFGTPMLFGSLYGTYQARVDGIAAVTDKGRRIVVSDISPVGNAKPARFRRARILVKAGPPLAPGDIIEGPIRFYAVPGPVLPNAYDSEFHAYFDGIGAFGTTTKPIGLVRAGDFSAPDRLIDTVRQSIGARIEAALAEPAQGIARALITGDQTGVTDAARQTMATAGLAHVLSISGLHLTLVAGTVFSALRLLFALILPLARHVSAKKLAAAGGIVAALVYYAISGGDIAALRSTVMIILVFGAILAGRKALTMRNVALAGLVTIVTDPANVFRPSFQLSFAAVIGLVGMYEILKRGGPKGRGPVGHIIAHFTGILTTSLIAGAATTVFSIYYFQQTSPLGVIGNLITLPLVGFVMMPAAMLSVIAMPFGFERPFLWVMGWSIDRMLDLAALVAGWSQGLNASPLLTPLALAIALMALAWFSFFTNRWRLLGPALAVPAIIAFALDQPPDVLVSDATQALAIRGAGGLVLAAGKANSFAVDVWSQTFKQAIGTPPPNMTRCDAEGCVSQAPAGFRVAVSRSPASLGEDCREADLVIIRADVAPPGCRAATTVIDRGDLAKGGVQWLHWDAGARRFDVRPAVADLNRPWRAGR
ncbi:MAG TPA: ComEC/Rec2 family competence protein [Devosia sp.]|nr:ComEC/Rec2 family competence protein [Devosia sp.]